MYWTCSLLSTVLVVILRYASCPPVPDVGGVLIIVCYYFSSLSSHVFSWWSSRMSQNKRSLSDDEDKESSSDVWIDEKEDNDETHDIVSSSSSAPWPFPTIVGNIRSTSSIIMAMDADFSAMSLEDERGIFPILSLLFGAGDAGGEEEVRVLEVLAVALALAFLDSKKYQSMRSRLPLFLVLLAPPLPTTTRPKSWNRAVLLLFLLTNCFLWKIFSLDSLICCFFSLCVEKFIWEIVRS